MKQALKIGSLAVLIALGSVAQGIAGPRGGMGDVTFESLDTDSSGGISQAELQARHSARFATADTDGDGKLTQAELEAAGSERAKKRAAKMIEHLDADGDGALSEDEMKSGKRADRAGKMFDRIDSDDNGEISREEFDTAKARMAERRAKKKN